MLRKWGLALTVCLALVSFFTVISTTHAAQDGGDNLTSELWAKAVLKPPGKTVTLKWKKVGSDITPSGAQVVSGYFYADPNDFAYGSQYNPEVFVKVYIDPGGWTNIAFNHVTVDAVTVYSAHNYGGTPNKTGEVTLSTRLAEHQYDGVSIDRTLSAAATASGDEGASLSPMAAGVTGGGYVINSGLWEKAVLKTKEKDITLIWKEVGADTTLTGARVVSGYFYADPKDFAYGSIYNPEIFVKIYIAPNGWANIATNHVTVDDVAVYSSHNYNGTANRSSAASLQSRLVEHEYTGVIIEAIQASVGEKVSRIMGTFSSGGDMLTPLTTELGTILNAAMGQSSTVPLTITPPLNQIDMENPPPSITMNLNYGSGYTAADGATMTGALNVAINNIKSTDSGTSLTLVVSADQVKRNGELVLDCEATFTANIVTSGDLMSADLSVNISNLDTLAGSVSGQVALDINGLSIETGTFQPITISFTNFLTPDIDINSGSIVITSIGESNMEISADMATSEGQVKGKVSIDSSNEEHAELNSVGTLQLGDYSLDINSVIFNPETCDSYPVSGNVGIVHGSESHTMTFTGSCDSYQFQ